MSDTLAKKDLAKRTGDHPLRVEILTVWHVSGLNFRLVRTTYAEDVVHDVALLIFTISVGKALFFLLFGIQTDLILRF